MKYIQNFNYHTHTERCGHAEKDYEDEAYVKEGVVRSVVIMIIAAVLLTLSIVKIVLVPYSEFIYFNF